MKNRLGTPFQGVKTLKWGGGRMPDYELREMIKTASKKNHNIWDRWKKKEIIPCTVIQYLWDNGIKFHEETPIRGMKLKTFLESLWELYLRLPEGKDSEYVFYLYVDTVESDRIPYWRNKIRRKKSNWNKPL